VRLAVVAVRVTDDRGQWRLTGDGSPSSRHLGNRILRVVAGDELVQTRGLVTLAADEVANSASEVSVR
jgi:hypothetical protein